MKQVSVISIFVLVIMLFGGCSSTDMELVKDSDGYYLLVNEPAIDIDDRLTCEEAPSIQFNSIEEMLNDIETGNFTDAEMEEIVRFDRDEQERVILFDLDDVLEPIYPSIYDGISVYWDGRTYGFMLNSSLARAGFDSFSIISPEYYTQETEHYLNFEQYLLDHHLDCEGVTVENRDGVAVMVYDYNSRIFDVRPWRLCTYTLSDIDTELFIVESDDPNTLKTPDHITIYGKSGDIYFEVGVTAFTDRPSPEWLLGFDFKPYTA